MARSVSRPTNAWHVAYAHWDCDDSDDASYEWRETVRELRRQLLEAFPSLHGEDRWLDREDHVLAANHYGAFGISEYCGLVSVWVVAEDIEHDSRPGARIGLRDRWLDSIEGRFRKVVRSCFGEELQRLGTFSNGESFYQRVPA